MTGEQAIGFLLSEDEHPYGHGFRIVGTCCAKRVGDVLLLRECQSGIWHAPKAPPVPICPVNIYPYKQTCCECGRVLVAGQPCGMPEKCERTAIEGKEHTHWCELYS